MKIFISIITLIGICTGLSIHFFDDEPLSSKSALLNDTSKGEYKVDESLVKLSEISSRLKEIQELNTLQLQSHQSEQRKLIDKINKIEGRLGLLEISQIANEDNTGRSKGIDTNTDMRKNESLDKHLVFSEDKATEHDISLWIDESIANGNVDAYSSEKALSELTSTLNVLPGVNAESLYCGDGFCRAKLSHDNGFTPDITNAIGLPPFVGSGFSKPNKNGELTFYFTQEGVSMNELQEKYMASIE